MRHKYLGKQALHCKAQRISKGYLCRCRRNQTKENALTGGGLLNHELDWEKSAEVIVPRSYEPMNEAEVLQFREGLNVGLSPIRKGCPNFEFASLYLNKDRGIIGVKSDGAGTQRTAVYETRTCGGVRGVLTVI